MKVVGIFRGFPGLGRVVAGVETLRLFKQYYNASIYIFSYLQGFDYCKNIFETQNFFTDKDISSIGVIPVSQSGELTIDAIEKINPDIVLIDGEPLLLTTIKLRFPDLKIITLLNPYDVDNPYNKLSSQLFFKDCYSKADYAIVHGIWNIQKPHQFRNIFLSLNTILRNEILEIKPCRSSNRIVCILGGGSVNTGSSFFNNTIEIAKKAILIANVFSNYQIDIYCSCKDVYDKVRVIKRLPSNIRLHRVFQSPSELYSDTKLVIARGGRNTISELLYLQMPSILFATSCKIRGIEQYKNLQSVHEASKGRLNGLSLAVSNDYTVNLAESLLNSTDILNNDKWESGNYELSKFISYHFS